MQVEREKSKGPLSAKQYPTNDGAELRLANCKVHGNFGKPTSTMASSPTPKSATSSASRSKILLAKSYVNEII